MENQGYEEDQSHAAKEQSILESRYRDRQFRANAADDGPFVTEIATHPDSHVYEDITTKESSSEFSEQISLPDESRSIREAQDQRPADFKQAWTNKPPTIISPVIGKSIPQDSTLPSSAPISANHDSGSSSSRAVSRGEDDNEVSSKHLCELPRSHHGDASECVSSSFREDKNSLRDASTQSADRRPNRRRRKKDCKHCKSKLAGANSCEKLDHLVNSKDAILRENGSDYREEVIKEPDASTLLFRDSLLRSHNVKIYPFVNRTSLRDTGTKRSFSAGLPVLGNMENGNVLFDHSTEKNKTVEVLKSRTDMRVNSIYSQDRWINKDPPIFYIDVKDQNHFQRAYSLPTRTHTPTSQNRVNLRRSVRNDPPPHPARLDKHRRGWTLHLARPLKTSGCSSSFIPLLVVVLILLGVAGVALYIVFEPEKLQVIHQYLKSSTGKLTGQNFTSGESFTPAIPNDEPNAAIKVTGTTPTDTSTTTTTTTTTATSMMMKSSVNAFTMSELLNGELSFPASIPSPTDTETEDASQNANVTRYCDDCFESEVCVAFVDDEVPICRTSRDSEDPTGCGGFCLINKQKCHRLDVDAFRCVNIEHGCLEDEWTCSNALCIPMEKHCDGHMNCYDHSDEYDCACDLETHFQCGNETSCLPLERRCDGKIDCWDATDEINCTLACPLESEFTCNNGECILKVRFCDGLADCSDGSDEPHGCQGRCNKHEFTCQNGRCIAKGMKCNGIDDCGDNTDERYCKDRIT